MAKLKRINLGHKQEVCCEPNSEKDKINYPCIYLRDKKLPITPEDVGKTFSANVTLKVVGVNTDTKENKESFSYDFEVREIVFNK